MIHHSENPRREMSNGEAGVVGAVLGFGLIRSPSIWLLPDFTFARNNS